MLPFAMRWVVAFPPEAAPVIDHFALKRDRSDMRGGFPVYRCPEDRVRLVVSGIGKVASAASTAWLAALDGGEARPALWINWGLAGGHAPLGAVRRGSRVVDHATGRNWYPQAVWSRKCDLPESVIRTVDAPSSAYDPDGTLLEMEASGFVPVAMRFATAELVQVVKVVSDGPEHSMEAIDAARARRLCREAFVELLPWLEAVGELVGAEEERIADPPGFQAWCERVRFTATQRHQLRRLLLQGQGRGVPASEPERILAEGAMDAGTVLERLRRELRQEAFPGGSGPGRSRPA